MQKFGVARKYAKDISRYVEKLNENNVDAYEMGFAYGIPTPNDFSDDLINYLYTQKISLSCHLPFWINLGNSKKGKNLEYLVSGLNIVERLNTVAVFHLGFYGEKSYQSMKESIVNTIKKAIMISNTTKGRLGIETTGKQKAIGKLDEIIELVNLIDDEKIIPVIDWSHLYARNNGTYPYTYDDFRKILENIEENIGYKPFYFHGGGVEYINGNEKKHLSAKKNQPPLPHLFTAMQDLDYNNFTFIIESPESIEDVKWVKKVWKSPKKYYSGIPKKRKSLFDYI